jgi:hypothetical protein
VSRATLTLGRPGARAQALRWVQTAPDGTRLTFAEAKRTGAQNDLMWDLLTDIAKQVPWHGVKLSADDFKLIFMAALNQEMRIVPNLDGTGFVNLGRSSSQLSKAEMGDLIDLIFAFCAERGVKVFDSSQEPEAAQQAPPVAA